MARANDDGLFKKLQALPDVVDVAAIKTDTMFRAGYELRVRQPLDHANPGGGTFLQSVYVGHIDEASPVLFETEGYSVRGGGRPKELATILRCNQIIVEHRFFGTSAPDSLVWKYLTTKQAADDHHHITTLLKGSIRGSGSAAERAREGRRRSSTGTTTPSTSMPVSRMSLRSTSRRRTPASSNSCGRSARRKRGTGSGSFRSRC